MDTNMNLHQDMDREQMRLAILSQEQIFRQQVHELHRLYHVQKQLMHQQAQPTAPATASRRAPAPVVVDVKPRPPPHQQLDIWCGERATTTTPPQQQIISFTSCNRKAATTPAPAVLADECNLELTLATGPSSSSSSCDGERLRRQGKRLKASSNSDSGVSSTSTDSELARFGEVDVAATPAVRFHGEVGRRMDEMGQGPWMYQCLSLKMA